MPDDQEITLEQRVAMLEGELSAATCAVDVLIKTNAMLAAAFGVDDVRARVLNAIEIAPRETFPDDEYWQAGVERFIERLAKISPDLG